MAGTPRKGLRGAFRQLVPAMLLLLWLATVALTASPQLHFLLHSDSQSPKHDCLITQLQQQPSIDSFLAVVLVIAVTVWVPLVYAAPSNFRPNLILRLSPSRAPPGRVFSFTVAG